MNKVPSYPILGVNVSATNLQHAYEQILNWIKSSFKSYVCVAPVSTIIDAQRDSEYHRIVNEAGMVTPDGMPVVWLGRIQGFKEVSRTYGPDLLPFVAERGVKEEIRHFFYGGTEEVFDVLIKNLKQRFKGIKIVGCLSPPLRKIGEIEPQDVINQINQVKPDILWIGLGSPKQDYWMANHRDKLEVPVMVGVGAAFDFLAGVKKQAPKWVQRSGMEWFFRLCCEPRRLWKRYIIGNTKFIYWLIKDFFKNRFQTTQS